MSDDAKKPHKPRAFLPILDDEARYQNSPHTVTQRADRAIERTARDLYQLVASMEIAAEVVPDEFQHLFRFVTRDANDAGYSLDALIAIVREMAACNQRLVTQRQNAHDAYERGWRDSLDEVMAALHPDDQQKLRAILDGQDAEPDDFDDLPF